MRVIACENAHQLGDVASELILDLFVQNPEAACCLPTGSTPIPVYQALVEKIRTSDIKLNELKFFNLDEYVGLGVHHNQSYAYFLFEHLFSQINVDSSQITLLNGLAADLDVECTRYNQLIDAIGNFDFVMDGIGVNGHIAFNEPAEFFIPRTHISAIAPSTIEANKRFFAQDETVPDQALTIGLEDIMKAKRFVLIATGANKKAVIERFFNEPEITTQFPMSFLRMHPNFTMILDKEACGSRYDYFRNHVGEIK